MQAVVKIYNYYKKFGYKTQVKGASFRNFDEIKELAGCDLLTIAPKFLAELDSTEGILERKLDPMKAQSADIEKIAMDPHDRWCTWYRSVRFVPKNSRSNGRI